MSPEIRIGKRTIINVPDATGMYRMPSGDNLYVGTDLIDADRKLQNIVLASDAIGGVRVLELRLDGIGDSQDPKRGDGKEPRVQVKLNDRPIRVAYSPRIEGSEGFVITPWGVYWGYDRGERRTLKNPRWTRGHGRR